MFSLELFETVTGARLGELPLRPFVASIGIRGSSLEGRPDGVTGDDLGALAWTVHELEAAGWINRAERGWQNRLRGMFMPVRHGIMLLWDGVPIAGGPIGSPVEASLTEVRVMVDSLGALFARRHVVPEQSYGAARQLHWKNLTLGSIAARVVGQGMAKPAGALPIDFPPDKQGGHERTFQGFNVANLDVRGVLAKLANVEQGPDIQFRPKIIDETRFGWDLLTGNPHLGQSTIHDWEQGSPDVLTVDALLSAEFVAHRVYAVGGESDVSTPVLRRDIRVPDGWPLLERVVTDTDISYTPPREGSKRAEPTKLELEMQRLRAEARLRALANAHLARFPLLQVTARVRAGVNRLGEFWPGEVARFAIHDHPLITPGVHDLRILSMRVDETGVIDMIFDPIEVDQT